MGYLTLAIAKDFQPSHILGIDIDDKLVGVARKNIRHYCGEGVEVGSSQYNLPMRLLIYSTLFSSSGSTQPPTPLRSSEASSLPPRGGFASRTTTERRR